MRKKRRDALKELFDIETALRGVDDGAGLDLNFEQPGCSGVRELVVLFEHQYQSCSGYDSEGREFTAPMWKPIQAGVSLGGYAMLEFWGNDSAPFSVVKVFISTSDGSSFEDVELTIWPGDLNDSGDLRQRFLAWVYEIRAVLRAKRFYFRSSSVSWKYGNIKPGSGVIAVSEDFNACR